MIDISKTVMPRSDQITADHLIAGPMKLTIRRVAVVDSDDQPVLIYVDETPLPFKPCKSMRRVLISIWGLDGAQYIGRSLTVYNDQSAMYGGVRVGGVRISHMSGITSPENVVLTERRGKKILYRVEPLATTSAPTQTPPPAPQLDIEAAHAAGRQAALGGADAMREWWKNNPQLGAACRPILDELKSIAALTDTTPAATTKGNAP